MAEVEKTKSEVSVSDILSKSWELLNNNLKVLAGLALVYILPSVLLGIALGAVLDVDSSSATNFNPASAVGVIGGVMLVALVVAVYQLIITAVLISVYIKLATGTKVDSVTQALELGKAKIGKVILAMFAVGIIVVLGMIMLIVPGLIAAFLLGLTVYIVADTEMSIGDAMSLSVKYATTYFLPIILLGLVFVGLGFLSGIVSAIFTSLPASLYTLVSTTINTALQIFGGLTAAVFYLDIKKRFKA